MSVTVWLLANTLSYPEGGGHLWVYLNWALGLRDLGCRVTWVETVMPNTPRQEILGNLAVLKTRLDRYDLSRSVALCSRTGDRLPEGAAEGGLGLEAADDADLLLNLSYDIPPALVGRFRRSALVDIDPGLTQVWMAAGHLRVPRHDLYVTIGETVGRPEARFPDCGIRWRYTPPPVFIDAWAPTRADSRAPYTTVTHWWGALMECQGQRYYNGKRDGFLPFLDLPRRITQPLELAVCFGSGASKRPPALFPPRSQTTKDTAGGLAPWPKNSLTREGSSGEYWNGRQHRSESPSRIEKHPDWNGANESSSTFR